MNTIEKYPETSQYKRSRSAFTIVELVVVIAVIGILGGIVTVGYKGWRERSYSTAMKSDLHALASAMDDRLTFTNSYPSSIPSNFTPSKGNVVQLNGVTSSYFCANVFNSAVPKVTLSYDSSKKDFRSYPCSGMPSGSAVGGTVPNAPRGTNLAGDFTNWTLAGTAAVSSDILTLGNNGNALSPLIRVNEPANFAIGGEMKAAQQAVYASFQPNGGFHVGSTYYAADGTTAVANSGDYTGNGCAESIPLNGWQTITDKCTWWAGGPNVVYIRLRFYSSASGYSSPDLQIRNPSLVTKD